MCTGRQRCAPYTHQASRSAGHVSRRTLRQLKLGAGTEKEGASRDHMRVRKGRGYSSWSPPAAIRVSVDPRPFRQVLEIKK
ncbi:hypothetical protein ACLOJK_012675 [Asimina triloba]